MDRRGFITMFGNTMLSAGWLDFGSTRTPFLHLLTSLTPIVAPETTATYDAKLQGDMKQLSTRVYSEEGIAMILACEDLTARKPIGPSSSKKMNTVMSTTLQKYVDSWLRLHPDAPAGDLAKLVELLAYKDFAGGGKDTDL